VSQGTEAFLIPTEEPKAGKSVLIDDALIASVTDRMERLIHALSMTLQAGGLPKPAVKALVEARIGIVAVLARLNKALVEAEEDDEIR